MTQRLLSTAVPALALCLLACGGDEKEPSSAAGAPNAGSGGASNPSHGGRSGSTSAGSSAAGTSSSAGGAAGRAGGGSGGAKSNGGNSTSGGSPAQAGTVGQAGAPTGCGSSAATGVQEKTILVGSTERTYVLSVPTGYSPDPPPALVFAWHGLGGDGALARRYFGIESRAGKGAVFVYPDGLATGSEGKSGWDLAANGGDVAFFDALLAEVSREYCVDPERIFSTGHSFGAMISNALGCYRGNVLRAIAPVAGSPPRGGRPGSASTCMGEVAAWIAHGENDGTVDFMTGGVATRDFWLGRNSCSTTDSAATTPEPCVAYSGCGADLPVHWCVHQDDHDWPSFAAAGIWAFFSSFQ